MILVTLGTQNQPFYRLLDYIENSKIKDEIIVQAGGSIDYKSKKMQLFKFINYDEMLELASLGAVVMHSRSIELTKKYNIKTNTVSPSMTLTPFAKKSYTEDEIKQTAMKNPSGRLGEVEDTVNAVLFLLSEKADYINGENLNVNGGILLV